MSNKYILSIDQSTQGTKGLIFDQNGRLLARADRPHRQIVDEQGWVEHDPQEILSNVLTVAREVAEKAQIRKDDICALGISNQRETALAWDRETGKAVYNAIVWQCARGASLCAQIAPQGDMIRSHSGLPLSPYFSAAKLGWIMQNVAKAKDLAENHNLCCGTVDSFLVYNLTKDQVFKTDYSNASRTQLFNIYELNWDIELCQAFGVPIDALPTVCMSDSCFGYTDLDGWLDTPIPIHAVLGDSHGALFGQACHNPGDTKATYGTGSSVMMNIGETPVQSKGGLVTSLAWGMDGKVHYVLEGNLNYTGAVITWLKKDLRLIEEDSQADEKACAANPTDSTYCVPAFTGLGAPYWDSEASALLTGMRRTTGNNEVVKAALECIAYQITDLIELMRDTSGLPLHSLRVDGGPTASKYLMQFQANVASLTVQIPDLQELSGMGAAFAAGIAMGVYNKEEVYSSIKHTTYSAQMDEAEKKAKYDGWKWAVRQALTHP